MSGGEAGAPLAEAVDGARPDRPTPEFEVLEARPVERSLAPTLAFRARVGDASGRAVYTIAASILITIEPAKRSYDGDTRARLVELFGEPGRWATTTTSFRWAQVDVLVPRFAGATEFEIPVPCTYDVEVAAAKYLHGLADGQAPLRFHFSGTILYQGEGGAIQMVPIPWDCSVRYSMPVSAWQRMIAAHYPHRGWIPLHTETIERLSRRKTEAGAPTYDDLIERLLEAGDG